MNFFDKNSVRSGLTYGLFGVIEVITDYFGVSEHLNQQSEYFWMHAYGSL